VIPPGAVPVTPEPAAQLHQLVQSGAPPRGPLPARTAAEIHRDPLQPLGANPVPPYLQSGMSPPMSKMQQPPLPRSIAGEHGPAIIVRVGPAGADVAKTHLHHGGSIDALIEAAALSLRQAAMVHGSLDPARCTAWVRPRLAFLSEIPDAGAIFGTIDDAQHAIEVVMAHRAARGDAVPQPVPSSKSMPPPSSTLPPNALMPVAQSAVPGGRPQTSVR